MSWTKTFLLLFLMASASSLASAQNPQVVGEHTEETSKNRFLTEVVMDADGQPQRCSDRVFEERSELAGENQKEQGVKSSVGKGWALLVFVGIGIFAALVAQGFQLVRKHIYHDADNLDTAFDAGGKVSIGLTATTIVSQWTWSATLLQSTTVASKFGISGPYWYAAGATIQIILFAILSIMLKTRAPGAKTFLQIIRSRFGRNTHLVFCCFAFFTNIIVMMSLLMGGTAVLNSLVDGLSPELATLVLTAVIGGYTLIGGLGATFYVSYFNTALIFILILVLIIEVFHNPSGNENNPFGSSYAIHDLIACWKAPEGNRHNSYLTFFSAGGFIFGIVNIVGNFGTVFCDQAYWQSSVAAKPVQGVWGFIAGGLTWFAIPFSMATTMGLAYLGLSSANGAPLLNDADIAKGLAAPVVAQNLLGSFGEYAMLLLILMAVMSTGSAEVIAVASILIYDVYQCYVQPFRPDLKPDQCLICGKHTSLSNTMAKWMMVDVSNVDRCSCQSAHDCEDCLADVVKRRATKGLVKPHFSCPVHKDYKEYQEQLLSYKNWCIVGCTILLIPLCLFGWAVNLNLAWTYYFTGTLISSAVVPIMLSILWSRTTAAGMMSGAIGGCICGIISWLVVASGYEGGLSSATFIKNTGEEIPMLVGNLVSFVGGAIFSVTVSFITRRTMTRDEVIAEWDKTRNIDNPLNPWVNVYEEELELEETQGYNIHDRPPLDVIGEIFKKAKWTAYIAGGFFTLVFVVIWPASMLSTAILGSRGFDAWTIISRIWAFAAAAFIIIVPFSQEVVAIVQKAKENKNQPPVTVPMKAINGHHHLRHRCHLKSTPSTSPTATL